MRLDVMPPVNNNCYVSNDSLYKVIIFVITVCFLMVPVSLWCLIIVCFSIMDPTIGCSSRTVCTQDNNGFLLFYLQIEQ